jgi:hypothetical protein
MDPMLLALACVGSSAALKFLFDREDAHEPPMMMPTQVFLDKLAGYTPGSSTGRTLTVPQASDDMEHGVHLPALPAAGTHDAEGVFHQQPALPVAAYGEVEDAAALLDLPATARLLKGVTAEGNTALHVVATHGDSMEFLECATIIHERDNDLLLLVNKRGDTPMHCAARAGKSPTVSHLIELAGRCNRVHELLRTRMGLRRRPCMMLSALEIIIL